MKKTLFLKVLTLLILFLSFSCTDQSAKTLNKTTLKKSSIETKPITLLDKGFHKAIFSPSGDKLITSTENDKGLSIYDIKNDVVEQLNSKDGAGMYPKFTSNGKYVVFQTHAFHNRRRMTSLYMQDVVNKDLIPIVNNKRNIKLLSVDKNIVYYLEEEIVKAYHISTGETINNPKNIEIAFTDNDLNLSMYSNGQKVNINPKGTGNYLWVSLSPDKNQILYNYSGKGTFITNLKDKTQTDLGRLHASTWSNDGKWIVGMDDYDDGHKYTKSDILMVSADGKTKKNLTQNSEVIALYPSISTDSKKVIYHNDQGRVFLMKLK